MRRFPKPAMEGLLQSQPGELFPGNKLPMPSAKDVGVHALTADQPQAQGAPGQLAAFTVFSRPDDPYGLNLTGGEFRVVSPEEAEKDADHINMMGQIDHAMRAVAALEELAAAIEPEVEKGLPDSALKITAIATNDALASVGLPNDDTITLEGHQDATIRTRVALESIKDKAALIWRKIVEAMTKALIWVKVKIKLILDRSKAILYYIQGIEDRAKKIKIPHTPPDSVPVSNLIWALQINGVWPEQLAENAREAYETVGSRLRFGYEAGLRRRFGPDVWDQPNTEHILNALKAGSFKSNDPRLRLPNTKTVGEVITRFSDELLGGRVVKEVSGTPEGIEKDPLRFALSNAVISDWSTVHPNAKAHTSARDTQVAVMDLRAMSSVLKSAFNLAASCNEFRGTLATLEVLAYEMVRAAKRMETEKSKDPKADVLKRHIFAEAPKWLVREPIRMADYALATARALAVYTDRCVRVYEAREARVQAS